MKELTKCDFCAKHIPGGNPSCVGNHGGDACKEATIAFREYMIALVKSQGSETTKNINITKND